MKHLPFLFLVFLFDFLLIKHYENLLTFLFDFLTIIIKDVRITVKLSATQKEGEVMSVPSLEDIGLWLRKARESLGLSQAEVAEEVGLPRPAISLIESGRRSVSSLELAKFADLYRRPLSYFLRPRRELAEDEVVSVLLRAENVTQKDHPELVSFIEFCKEYAFLERLVLGEVRFEIPKYFISPRAKRWRNVIAEGERLAMEERKRFSLGNSPIMDVFGLLEKEGVKIVKRKLPSGSKVSGCFFFSEDIGPCILVNSAHPVGRTNFTAAHEYCHFLSDLDLFSAYVCDLTDLSTRKESFEMRANAFAAAFLMPEDGIIEFFQEIGISRRSKIGAEEAIHIQKYFGVSYLAMLYRLQNLRWVSEEERKHLMDYKPTQVARQLGYDVEGEKEIEIPFPLRFVRLVIEAYKKDEISLGKLSELLKFPRQDTIDLLKSLEIPLRLGSCP